MTGAPNRDVFPVPGYRGGEQGNGERSLVPEAGQDRLCESSGNVPGTVGEHAVPRSPTLYAGTGERGTVSTRRKPYRVTARATIWGDADGSSSHIVKLYGGSRGSLALDYTQIPRLIADLATLLHEYDRDQGDQ